MSNLDDIFTFFNITFHGSIHGWHWRSRTLATDGSGVQTIHPFHTLAAAKEDALSLLVEADLVKDQL